MLAACKALEMEGTCVCRQPAGTSVTAAQQAAAMCQLPAFRTLTRLLMNSDMKIGTMVMMSTRLCQEKTYLQRDMVAGCGRLWWLQQVRHGMHAVTAGKWHFGPSPPQDMSGRRVYVGCDPECLCCCSLCCHALPSPVARQPQPEAPLCSKDDAAHQIHDAQ